MLKKMLFFILTIALTLSACTTLNVTIEQPVATPQPTPQIATQTPEPIQTPTEEPTAQSNVFTFTNLRFYWYPIKHGGCGPTYRVTFPAHVRRVRATWDYVNMNAKLSIRREWYHDGELWATYHELWDYAKYGANGTVDDTYIYDFDAGLPPGKYELRVFINDQLVFDPEAEPRSFTVDKDWSLEIDSPNGLTTAIIAEPDKLKLRSTNGTTWEVSKAHEIDSLAWFPDNKHIIYRDIEWPQRESCDNFGIRHTLWIVDAATGVQHSIEGVGEPIVSPDGKYVATTDGTDNVSGCKVDTQLKLIALDGNFQPTLRLGLQDFSGIPPVVDGSSIAPATIMGNVHWKDATHFETILQWTCPTDKDPSGIYSFDIENKQATRIGDLP